MYGQIRDRSKRTKVNFLSISLLRVGWTGRDERSEIPDSMDLVLWQNLRAEVGEVQPAIRRFAQTTVVQVEGVNVDIRPEGHKMQKPQDFSSGLAPLARRLGGDMRIKVAEGLPK